MCGITGIFNLDEKGVSKNTLVEMTRSLAHRGPDHEGIFLSGNLGLGNRRLAILDTSSKGNQPMNSRDGKWVITFNGCIYNFPQIKKKLLRLGHKFRSTSDTEVICEGLSRFGPDIFKSFNGMFAIGAWHKPTRTLYLTRDRFGVKPLYYFFDKKKLIFASEVKAILKHPNYKIGVNLEALNEYFTFQNLFSYSTLFKDIYLLPPANTIKITASTNKIIHQAWWDYDFSNPDEKMSFEDAKNETERLLKNAVRKQMISDVPVGSYLSGGMDSSSITALASRYTNRLCTFTAGFELSDVTGIEATFDERMDAEIVAHFYKTEHYEQVINAGDLAWSLPRVVWHLEDLKVGMSYPNFYISRLASKFVKVCLQGTGGDELYGGYPWRYYRVFKSLNQADFFKNYYQFWQRLVSDEDKNKLFTKKIQKDMDFEKPRQIFERVFTFNSKLKYETPEQHIQNSLYFEIKTFLPSLLLVGDKLSMANGLEERFPFLDNELVDFAQKIPIRHKLGNLEDMKKIDENEFAKKNKYFLQYFDGKNVLREAMKDVLPKQIVNRKKQGFSPPDESWYRGENAALVKDLLLNKITASSEFINQNYVKKIINQHIDKRINHRLLIWSFLNFEWWCRIFLLKQNFK